MAYINPAVAAVIGVLVLHEPFGVGAGVGLGMILFGSYLATGKAEEVGQRNGDIPHFVKK